MSATHRRLKLSDFEPTAIITNCWDCGKEMLAATTARKLCYDCRIKKRRKWIQNYYVRKAKKENGKNGKNGLEAKN